jgi:hypothetical protein
MDSSTAIAHASTDPNANAEKTSPAIDPNAMTVLSLESRVLSLESEVSLESGVLSLESGEPTLTIPRLKFIAENRESKKSEGESLIPKAENQKRKAENLKLKTKT